MSNREILIQLLALVALLLGALGFYAFQKSAAMVPTLLGYVDSASQREARAALARLGELGPAAGPAAPRLLAELRDDAPNADAALEALSRIDLGAALAARDHLLVALRTGDANARYRAAERLGMLGLLGRGASGDLALAARDADAMVRYRAMTALGRIGVPTAIVIPALIAALDDPTDYVRDGAVVALESYPPAAVKDALPALRHLAQADGGANWRAKHALNRLDGTHPPSVGLPALRYMLASGNRFGARQYALQRIAFHGPEAASLLPELLPLLASGDDVVRQSVIETLLAIGPAADAALPALQDIAAGPPPLSDVAREALVVIKKGQP